MKRYNTPHRHRVIKTRLTEEEYAEFSERVTLCKMSQAEFIRQALIKSSIRPVITVSPVNDELLSAVGKLTAEYGKIGGNLNQIARCLNEYGAPYNALSQEVRAAIAELAALKFEVLQKAPGKRFLRPAFESVSISKRLIKVELSLINPIICSGKDIFFE